MNTKHSPNVKGQIRIWLILAILAIDATLRLANASPPTTAQVSPSASGPTTRGIRELANATRIGNLKFQIAISFWSEKPYKNRLLFNMDHGSLSDLAPQETLKLQKPSLFVPIFIENLGTRAESLNSLVLIDKRGATYQPSDYSLISSDAYVNESLNPGSYKIGVAVFDAPKDGRSYSLIFLDAAGAKVKQLEIPDTKVTDSKLTSPIDDSAISEEDKTSRMRFAELLIKSVQDYNEVLLDALRH